LILVIQNQIETSQSHLASKKKLLLETENKQVEIMKKLDDLENEQKKVKKVLHERIVVKNEVIQSQNVDDFLSLTGIDRRRRTTISKSKAAKRD
jgi:hypothetical protein